MGDMERAKEIAGGLGSHERNRLHNIAVLYEKGVCWTSVNGSIRFSACRASSRKLRDLGLIYADAYGDAWLTDLGNAVRRILEDQKNGR